VEPVAEGLKAKTCYSADAVRAIAVLRGERVLSMTRRETSSTRLPARQ